MSKTPSWGERKFLSSKLALIGFDLKNSLRGSGGCTDGLFPTFLLRPTSLCPRHLPEVRENFYLQNWLSLVLTSRTALEALKALLMDFFQLFWLRPTSLCPRHLQEGNVNCYLQNWLSLVLTSRTASEALKAVLMDLFQFFCLTTTSLCPRHLSKWKKIYIFKTGSRWFWPQEQPLRLWRLYWWTFSNFLCLDPLI